MSYTALEHYIDGNWVKPTGSKTQEVMNPAKNTPIGDLGFASKGDLEGAGRRRQGLQDLEEGLRVRAGQDPAQGRRAGADPRA